MKTGNISLVNREKQMRRDATKTKPSEKRQSHRKKRVIGEQSHENTTSMSLGLGRTSSLTPKKAKII